MTDLAITVRYRQEYLTGRPARAVEEEVTLPARTAALLLVDVYPRHGPHADVVRRAIAPARQAARFAGLPVIFVTNQLAASTTAESQWTKLWQRTLGANVLDTWKEPSDVFDYLPEIAPDGSDIVVRKQHYSGFAETDLDGVLRAHGIRDLFIAGFDARICVAATATDALARDYRVFVLRDAIATTEMPDDAEAQPALIHALRYIEVCVGSTVTTTEFVRACGRATEQRS
jgi:nicotinamidase-related amidase